MATVATGDMTPRSMSLLSGGVTELIGTEATALAVVAALAVTTPFDPDTTVRPRTIWRLADGVTVMVSVVISPDVRTLL